MRKIENRKCKDCNKGEDKVEFYRKPNGRIYNSCCKNCFSVRQTNKSTLIKEKRLSKISIMEGEEWKDVVDYEEFYEVSNKGRVRTKPRQTQSGDHKAIRGVRYFTLYEHPDGYINVGLIKESKKVRRTSVHRLVAVAFIDRIPGKEFVNHINGIKNDNRVENLEWCTKKENSRHSFDNGLQVNPKGQEHHWAKLTEEDVLKIRNTYKPNGVYTTKRLAKEYGISNTNIKDIVNRKIWTHL